MFELLQDAASALFGGGSQEQAPAAAAAAEQPGAGMATGTPSPEAANALFGGLFGPDPALKEASKEVREAMQVQAAKDKLKDKFNVGGEPGGGMNDVTPEEFDKLAKLYNDIDKGKTDIQLDASAFGKDKEKAAEAKGMAMEDIAKMMQTPSGRQMLQDLADNPSQEKDKNGEPIHRKTNIKLSNDEREKAQCDEAGMAAARGVRDREACDAIEKKSTTPGVGTDANVVYHPGETKQLPGDVAATGDTTLFHELSHAHHMTHGTKVHSEKEVGEQATHDGDRHADEEEYAAAGLGKHAYDPLTENQYRYERWLMGEDEMQPRPRYN